MIIMKKTMLLLTFFVFGALTAAAQKGTAEPGTYPYGYGNETWTGRVTAVKEETREFTLTYKMGDKEKTFVGVLPKDYKAKKSDGKFYEVKMEDLMNLRIRAYYMVKTEKVNGTKVKINEVFQIKFLPDVEPK